MAVIYEIEESNLTDNDDIHIISIFMNNDECIYISVIY